MAGNTTLKLSDDGTQAHADAQAQLAATNAQTDAVKNLGVVTAAGMQSIAERVGSLVTQEQESAPPTSNPKPGKRSVDAGADALATYVHGRLPGLRVPALGGPTVASPAKISTGAGESMVMTVTAPDGTVYIIEVYRNG